MIVSPEPKRRAYREAGWWGDKTLADLFFANATRHPDRLALVDAPNRASIAFGEPARLTYAEMRDEVERLAGALLAAGIDKDDVIVVQLPNISEFVALYFAAATIGAIVSPVAVQYRSHELSTIFDIVKPRAYVCGTHMHHADHLGVARPLLRGDVALMTFGPDAPEDAVDLSNAQAKAELLRDYIDKTKVDADDIFTICWTSGTTGMPKGVPRSHNHWIAIAPGTYQPSGLREGDVLLNPFPLINMASIGGVTMSWLKVCGTMVLHHPFDPQVYLGQIAMERPQFTIAPPAILNMLLQDEALLAKVDLSSLRTIGSGSAPLAPAMVRGFQDRFGIMVVNLFGSNEGMSLVTGPDAVPDPFERASYFPREMVLEPMMGGAAAPIAQTRLVPPEGGAAITEEGVAGELQISGPAVFESYHDAPDQTEAAFTEDGFYKSGDLFEIAGGGRFYRFVGRCKDLIIRGGVNISPEEIDQLLGGHPDLAEACVFALPDPIMGERIGVAAVPRGGAAVTLDDITRFLREQDLAVFKLPERLFEFDSLPRNVTNKVMRSEVRDMALAMLEGAD
ncbi:class I adenylate-forming enzyme family protein [Altererythrobacter arenosus]|uniref:Class I adenylate-forming enzyme family protein n=1 Tax=Altererythrobacter arenosus TaxID=3032592 RepID=A0ABY8FNF4_9SPHN|nr:class I adenylate-forming enzyme family protein [Altererythrobacter sp. CAU 1644]WFL76312.1 class I adenylate-forming enzyme family protein [Altererythrobacter sp. CAU 1644]